MNFFKLYMGDYQRDTGALSIAEHGAYFLMLQYHYATEKPLPKGKDLYRMLRCESKAERDAVDTVAGLYWTDTPEGWTNNRACKEMDEAHAYAEAQSKRANKRWNKPADMPPHMPVYIQAQSPTDASHSHSHNHSQTKSTAVPALLSKAMRENGVESQPGDPRIIALAEQGVTPETVAAACVELKRQKPGERISPGLVASVITRWAKDATKIQGAQAPSSKTASALMSLEGMKHEPTGIQHGDGERPAEVAGFIPAKHASG